MMNKEDSMDKEVFITTSCMDNSVGALVPGGTPVLIRSERDLEIYLHVYVFVPLEGTEDDNETWSKVYQAWGRQCDMLGFNQRAEYYRIRAEEIVARDKDPLGR